MTNNMIHGPVVSSSDIGFHTRMFVKVFDMQLDAVVDLDAATVQAAWGLVDHNAKFATLRTPGSVHGVSVLQLQPRPAATIRDRSKGLVAGAAKVIDFFTTDLERALERARGFGLKINADIAEYDSPEGPVREAHAWIQDEVVCAFIDAPDDMFARFSAGLDRLISEPQSISGPTYELAAAREFFHDVFSFDVIYQYEVKDSNFADMIGSSEPVHIRANNVGTSLQKPYIGMIDYGLPASSRETMPAVAMPVRGLLGVSVVTSDLGDVYRRSATADWLADPATVELGAWGRCETAVVRAPNGMLLQVVEPQGAYW